MDTIQRIYLIALAGGISCLVIGVSCVLMFRAQDRKSLIPAFVRKAITFIVPVLLGILLYTAIKWIVGNNS